jgi:2-polyprenyl-3-methyl-5-hydroxy-6-metoxy-1,4-benzoquinol methylase
MSTAGLLNDEDAVWTLGSIPFYIGAQTAPTNAPLPDVLPMRIGVDSCSGRLTQVPDPAVDAALDEAYTRGSQIGTPLSLDGAGQPALEDFLAFVLEARPKKGLGGAEVLEIGCGAGALLGRIAREGAHAVGVEPGQSAAQHARDAGLEVIAEPFTPERFGQDRFDVILHHAVLEHVADPQIFLAQQLELLTDDGLVICSVPDCTAPLAYGDLSMFVHEHFSYFTPNSLARLGELAGGEVVAARTAYAAGSIHCALRRPATRPSHRETAPRQSIRDFTGSARRSLSALERFCEGLANEQQTLGVYCPARFINYHALLGDAAPTVRYFDDDPQLHGRYFPPFDVPIEARSGLLARPVDTLVVMSWTFGERIAASLRGQPELADTTIRTIDELVGASAQ